MVANQGTASVRIGELAAALQLNPRTVRYYESIGLLPHARRTPAGYRVYGSADRDRLLFIGRAKALGMSLGQIRDILSLRDGGECPCDHVLGLVDRKLADLDEQLNALERLRQDLRALRDRATGTSPHQTPICAIIEAREPLI